jgi:hypothetical protein
MHTVELLEEALGAVKRLGYRIRMEPFDGESAGVCEFGGRRWLFLDVGAGPLEHLHAVLELLRGDHRADLLALSPPLTQLLQGRRAA